jgi:hypothetical protein
MPTYKTKPSLKANPKDFPLSSKKYSKANKEADIIEKKQSPKGYTKLKKISKSMKPGEIEGHINKKGKVTVSKKIPKKLRKEVATHDKNERHFILDGKA